MRVKLFTIIPLLLLLISIGFYSVKKPSRDEHRATVYKEFIEAVNSQDPGLISEQIVKHWSDTLIGENNRWLEEDLNYWLAASREFGPLDYVSYGEDTFNNNEVAWFKGALSGDWVGLEFDFNLANKVTGTNVLRSCMPSALFDTEITSGEDVGQQDLKDYFDSMENVGLFSGMVLVAKGDQIIYEGYHGFSDKQNNQPLTPQNRMVIASTTKMFTAIAIAQLVQENKLDLDAPISTYLPDFPKHIGEKVTTAHLLTHTSGIELDEIDAFNEEIAQARSIGEFYALNLKYLPQAENYSNWKTLKELDYSNENFDIMGQLVEVLSGQDFYSYLDQHIFTPSSMDNTGPVDMNEQSTNLALNYQLNREGAGEFDEGFRDLVPSSHLSYSRPAGAFYSTSRDLYAFLRAFNQGRLINDSLRQEFTSKKVENLHIPIYRSWYGYGFYVNERAGQRTNIGHAGGMPGVSSRAEYYPDEDVYVIVISNFNWSANMTANYLSTIVPSLVTHP